MLGLGCFCVLCFVLGFSVKLKLSVLLLTRLNLLFHYCVYRVAQKKRGHSVISVSYTHLTLPTNREV